MIFTKKSSPCEILALLVVFIPALTYLFYISGFEKNRSHYYMISYPFVALSIGWFASQLKEKFSHKPINLFIFLVFFITLIFSIKNTVMFIRKDTRVLLSRWIDSKISDSVYSSHYIYYDSEEFIQPLPEKALEYEDLSKVILPYLLVTKCSKEFSIWTPRNLAHYIDNNLRRGPEICIYESPYD